MSYHVATYRERPDLNDRWEQTVAPAWPAFLMEDVRINEHWDYVFEGAPDFQLYLVDDETDAVLALANTCPFRWSGRHDDLPTGIADVLIRAKRERDAGDDPTTLCALQAIVTEGNRGSGLAAVLVDRMRDKAERAGFADLVAPVRPSWKARYPLQDFTSYVRWTRQDGSPFDPWIRVHVRAGAEFMPVVPRSQTIEGTVEDWQRWTGMVFPDSGDYVVPGALIPVQVDVERDRGRIDEPNIWMRHRLADPAET